MDSAAWMTRSLDRRVSWRCGVGCESGRLAASAVSARAEGQSCAGSRNGLVAEHVRAHLQIRLRNLVHLQDTHLLTRIRARPFGLAHCRQGHVNTMPGRRGEPTLFPNFLEKFFGAAGRPRWTAVPDGPEPLESSSSGLSRAAQRLGSAGALATIARIVAPYLSIFAGPMPSTRASSAMAEGRISAMAASVASVSTV